MEYILSVKCSRCGATKSYDGDTTKRNDYVTVFFKEAGMTYHSHDTWFCQDCEKDYAAMVKRHKEETDEMLQRGGA